MTLERRRRVDDFYGSLSELELRTGGKRRLRNCTSQTGWPARGVYFFFEDGEFREDGITPRVVRIRTHGLRPSSSTLWKRLSQHRGTPGGSLPGGGNHRGSIFRLHVGSALLAAGDWPDEVKATWLRETNAGTEIRKREYPLEQAVSQYIGNMPFLWLEVPDEPSPHSDRGVIETGAIGLLSNLEREPIDVPSASWLGLQATRSVIGASGLWNVNHLRDSSTGQFLDVFRQYLQIAGG